MATLHKSVCVCVCRGGAMYGPMQYIEVGDNVWSLYMEGGDNGWLHHIGGVGVCPRRVFRVILIGKKKIFAN